MNDNILNNNYLKARKNIGICDLSLFSKYIVYGPNAINLLNNYSITQMNLSESKSFMTILMNRNKVICECYIIKLSPIKYLIITDDKKKKNLYRILIKSRRKFPLVTIENATNIYSFFSFHGEKSNEYFNKNKNSNIHEITHQSYTYYTMLTSSINRYAVLDHFKSIGFEEISLETRNIFLHNHNVITNVNSIKRKYRNNIISSLYKSDNFKSYSNRKVYSITQFEGTKNFLITKDLVIYNHLRRKIGHVHNYYRIPNKRHPYLLCIIRKHKFDKIAIVKYNKNEILLKEYNYKDPQY